MTSRILALAAAALVAPAVSSQINPAVGSSIGGVGDDTVTMVTLSFGFTFPDGSTVTDIFVDSNGRITAATTPSDFSPTVAEFLGDPSSLDPYFDDMNPVLNGGDIFFNDLGTSALLTWQDTSLFLGAPADIFTVQVEMFDDGSFKFRYDNRTPAGANDGIVGCTSGNGATDPGAVNLTAGTMSAGDPTIYEAFPGGDNDLIDGELCFTPDGLGGYDVTSTVADLFPASIDSVTAACNLAGPTLTFTPTMAGYDVAVGGSLADVDFAMGTDIGAGDDSVTMVTVTNAVTFPDGSVVNDLFIDSNGRITAATTPSDFSESTAEFVGDPSMVAVIWDDLSPNIAGAVWVHENANGVSVTWDGVPEFSSSGINGSNTAQAQFNLDGSIVLSYPSLTLIDCLVGVSAGNGATDPGEVDLSAGVVGGGDVVYEQFVGDFDLIPAQPGIIINSLPIIGASFDLDIANTGTEIGQFYLIGFPTAFNIGGIGGPDCSLLCDGSLLTLTTAPGTALPIPLPNSSALVMSSLNLQGATLDPASGFLLPILFTEAVGFTIGEF